MCTTISVGGGNVAVLSCVSVPYTGGDNILGVFSTGPMWNLP